MNELSMSRALMGTTRSNPGQTTTAYGIASSESADGLVMVDMGGDTVSPDDNQSIECETTFKVYEGDEVIVSLVGADGSGKTPIVVGVVGRGDEQQSEIDGMKNYFWVNDRGAHISTIEKSVEGSNVLVDADSLDIRYGENNSEDDQTLLAKFGRNTAYIGGIDGTPYWRIKDLRNGTTGYATVEDIKYGDGTQTEFPLDFKYLSVISVVVDGTEMVEDEDYTCDIDTATVTFTTAPVMASTIIITYTTEDGVFSYSEGIRAYGNEGPFSKVTGLNNTASGSYSQANGYDTVASGWGSTADGYMTTAASRLQKVSGQGNVIDNANKYAEIVGNGNSADGATLEHIITDGETVKYTLEYVPKVITSATVSGSGNPVADISYFNILGDIRVNPHLTNSGWYASIIINNKRSIPANHNIKLKGKLVIEYYDGGASNDPITRTFNITGMTVGFNADTTPYIFEYYLAGVKSSYNVLSATISETSLELMYLGNFAPYIIIDGNKISLPDCASDLVNANVSLAYRYVSFSRKNIYNLDWDGNAEFSGAVYMGGCTPNGTVDGFSAIRFNTGIYYTQYYNGSVWKNLHQFYRPHDGVEFGWDPGGEIDGTIRTDAVQGEGMITNSGKEIRLTFTLPGSFDLIDDSAEDSIVLLAMWGGMRGIKGYINSTGYNTDWLSILEGSAYTYAFHAQGNLLVMYITKTAAFTNYANNTPIVFSPVFMSIGLN